MHQLLMTLAQWPGRGVTKALLERRGYGVPGHFEEFACADCPEPASLEKYWDEVAMEYLCSAGRVNSDMRTVPETSYRSRYLDDLATERAKSKKGVDGFPLNDCLRDFSSKMLSSFKGGIPYLEWVETQMQLCKRGEIKSFGISADGWTGTKKDFYESLGNICKENGFQFKKKKWRKILDQLEICCSVDASMQRTWAFQLPLDMTILHTSYPDLVFHVGLADNIMPGFHYYRRYREAEEAILGIKAHVDLLNAVGELATGQSA